jgi:hypothetical protein
MAATGLGRGNVRGESTVLFSIAYRMLGSASEAEDVIAGNPPLDHRLMSVH